ncbi:Ig-like domain-containing protein, partial [Mycobacterium sp. AZCC_0083]|uniref:Ig-like domain-containing protein n=1 Tax=Mycobacterium sp. AZCC_0083 TaxID=2735882 RepID=UPI00160C5A21
MSLRGLEASRSPKHARKAETTYAKYVGRIGALAVSLGVGVAVATTPGMAWAAPDADSDPGASASPGPKTSPDSKPDASTPSKPDTETTSQTTATETSTDGSPSKSDTTPANDRVPTMKVDSSGGALTSTHHTAGEAAAKSTPAASDTASEPSTSEETVAPAEVTPVEPVAPVEPVVPVVEPVVEVPVVPVVEVPVEPVVNPTDPQNDSPKPSDGQTAGSDGKPGVVVDHVQSGPTDKGGSDTASAAADDTARHRSALTADVQTADSSNNAQMSTFAAPQVQAPTPAPFDPVGALLAIPGQVFDFASGFVALVITPFLAPTPNAPAQMPLLWTVLAWVRREISHTFFNRSPIANPVQISQTVTGEVSGNLNATDPNGDEPLTYTVTQQPAHGTVVVRPDGTYTYTPTAGAPTTTLTDSFSVTIDDSVGTQLPGIFGVVQGILHGFAQLIGIAQPDTIVKTVPVTVVGTGINLPPLVVTSVINPIPYTAGSAPRVLDSNLKVIDGSSNLSGGTVSVGLGFKPGDTLSYTPPANNPITGSYDDATGVLTLEGTATVAQYQEALRAVSFSTTAGALIGVRTVSFVVTDDGDLPSISVPLLVTVSALNLPPIVTTSVVGPIVTVGSPPVTLDSNVTIIDGSGSMKGAQVSLGLGFSPGDKLGYTAPQNNPITGAYNAATGTLTLSGTGTVAQYQEALRAVTFSTTAGALVGARTVSFVVTDDGDLSSISVPLAVTVIGLTLPVVVPGGLLVTYRVGDAPVVLASGLSVTGSSAQLSSATVTIGVKSAGDVLSWTPSAATGLISSVGYDAAAGTLTLSGTGTVAQYEAALQSVTFSSTTVGLLARAITYGVTDPGALLPAVSVPVVLTVLPALTLPVVVPGGLLVTYRVGDAPVVLASGLSVTGS